MQHATVALNFVLELWAYRTLGLNLALRPRPGVEYRPRARRPRTVAALVGLHGAGSQLSWAASGRSWARLGAPLRMSRAV